MNSGLLCTLVATALAPIASPSPAIPRSFDQSFEQNIGQTGREVKFFSRGPSGSVFVMEREIVLAPAGKRTLRMRLPGSFKAAGVNKLSWKTNYLRRVSVTGVENYSELRLRSADGLVLRLYYDADGELTYEWHVGTGTPPEKVQWRMDGEDSLAIDPRGDLVIRVGDETIRERRPLAYQESGRGRTEIAAAFRLTGAHGVGFAVAPYDGAKELVIDPTVYFAQHPGAAGDHIWAMAVDSAGNSYITGVTNSIDFPSATSGGGGLFVAKFSPDGSQLLYKAFLDVLGGQTGLAVDASGSAYITGNTQRIDSTTPTPNTIGTPVSMCTQTEVSFSCSSFGYVVKLNPAGSAVVYQTYIGNTNINSIAADATGAVYLTGSASKGFPATSGAYLTTSTMGAMAARLDPSGAAFDWATFLSNGTDSGSAIALDPAGEPVIAGYTYSANFPVSASAFQKQIPAGGSSAGFALKLTADGSQLIFSTLLGGTGDDRALAVAVDGSGDVYLAGSNDSTDFPTTANRLSQSAGGFVAKLNATGSALLYATNFFGASVAGMTVDGSGHVYFVGAAGDTSTSAPLPSVPTRNAIQSDFDAVPCPSAHPTVCRNGYVAGVDTASGTLLFSTWLQVYAQAVVSSSEYQFFCNPVLAPSGALYVGGSGSYSIGNYAPTHPYSNNLFLKLNVTGAPPVLTAAGIVNSASFAQGLVAPGGLASIFLTGLPLPPGTIAAQTTPLPLSLGNVSVMVAGVPAPLLSVTNPAAGMQQINFQVPFEMPAGITAADVLVRVGEPSTFQPDDIYALETQISWNTTGPAVYASNNAGIFQHGDYTLVTQSHPAHAGETLMAYVNGLGPVTPAVPSGTAAPLSPLSWANQMPSVYVGANYVGAASAQVTFAGLVPTLVGVYQVNFVVPPQTPPGEVSVILELPPVTSYPFPTFAATSVTPTSPAAGLWVQ